MYEIKLGAYHYIYIGVVLLIALQRLWEMKLSNSHVKILQEKGAIELGKNHLPLMKMIHVFWFLSCLGEGLFQQNFPSQIQVIICSFLLIAGQALRLLTMLTLKERWTINIMVLPGTRAIDRGIFRYIRHPNYLGVILEIFALPLLFGLYKTAITFS